MPTYLERALETIDDAERRLHAVIDEAVASRHFDEVPAILAIAQRLAGVVSGSHSSAEEGGPSPLRASAQQAVSGDNLPEFVREGEFLVKVARSRASGETYEHRAPRSTVDAVAARALGASDEGSGPFKAETLSDLRSHQDSQEIPGYQLYLCLGWFLREGLIRRHGRKGYTVVTPDFLREAVGRAWGQLTDRMGSDRR